MCQELGIEIDLEKNVEEIDLGDSAEEIDAMNWMLTHQLSSKNLSNGEKLAMMDSYKEEVKLEAKRKKIEAGKAYGENHSKHQENKRFTPNGENLLANPLHTDKEIAKKSGIGVGTVARYNKVMRSDDEELKNKMKTGQVTINKAYETVRKRERMGENADSQIVQANKSEIMDKPESKESVLANKEEANTGDGLECDDWSLGGVKKVVNDSSQILMENMRVLLAKSYTRSHTREVTDKVQSKIRNFIESLETIQELMNSMEVNELDADKINLKDEED
jgi:hypothetical protein